MWFNAPVRDLNMEFGRKIISEGGNCALESSAN